MGKKSNTENFIKKSIIIHGDRYDYGLVEYKNQKTKVKIICKEHDIFEQRPCNHIDNLKPQGCPSCAGLKKLNTDDFIKRSKIIHGDKYNYSFVDCKNSYTKVSIECKIHGIFEQKPDNHLNQKQGCPECGKLVKKFSTELFIKKSKEIHGDKYDYSLVEYKGANMCVKIICSKHGIFKQSPNNHTHYKSGCIKCKIENNTFTKEEFVNKSKKIHGDSFNYSLVNYVNNNTKVKIYCKKHKYTFNQLPKNHLNGQGCYYCGLQKIRISYLKEIQNRKNNGYQISPNFNKNACLIFDDISLKENIHIQHAMNGGEYHIKELGYWVDGYDKENNVVYEFDEEYHEKQQMKDDIRQQEIEFFLGCNFIRIKDK